MLEIFAIISIVGLTSLILCDLISSWKSKDISRFWCPMTFIDLVYIYYTIMPYLEGADYYGFNNLSFNRLSIIGAFISYLSCIVTFRVYKKSVNFKKYNSTFNEHNALKLAFVLFIIGFVGHVAFRGFSFSIFASSKATAWEKAGDFEFYFSSLVSLSCAACGLLVACEKRKIILIPILLLTLIIFIVAGFRYRIVMLIITMAVSWQLYPHPKKINYKILLPIAIVAFLFFGLMDNARQYGAGLNRNAVANFELSKVKGPGENASVFSFSGYVMDVYQNKEYVYFQPIWCAITLPIPRAIYPNKPNAEYLKNISTADFGGAAFTYYAEAFMAFGWFGIILYGIFLGLLSKRVWLNYQNNRNNINAILFLGLFNGFTFLFISRGYMAQVVLTFIYFVVLPFWIARYVKKRFLNKYKL